MPKISIVMSYYNRKKALWRTLKTMEKCALKDFELVIVDDASAPAERIEDFASKFEFIRLARIEPENKKHFNPCIPFNMGFGMASGEIVIIQNPECLYIGDVLSYVADNSKDNQYLVFSCYSLGEATYNKLDNVDFNLAMNDLEPVIIKAIGGFNNRNCDYTSRYDSWFAHPQYRQAYFNFLTSMTMSDLRDLGGFDERFADGHAFDDTDFVSRIQKKGMKIELIERPYCIHQYHPSFNNNIPNFRERERRNRMLYEEATRSPNYKVKNSFIKGIQ